MKKLLILFAFLLFVTPIFGDDEISTKEAEKVKEILVEMENAGDYTTTTGKAVMRIVDSEDRETVMRLVSFEKKGTIEAEDDMSLMRFTYPARLKGTAILTVGDNIWYYNNRSNRVRLLSQSAKKGSMMGSSFSYDDLSAKYSEDYIGKIIKDEKAYYILKLFPNDKGKKFKYMIVRVRKEDNIPELIEYYNDEDLKYKEMKSTNIKEVDGRTVPLSISMYDIEEGKITYFEIDEKDVKYEVELKDDIFSERNLRK